MFYRHFQPCVVAWPLPLPSELHLDSCWESLGLSHHFLDLEDFVCIQLDHWSSHRSSFSIQTLYIVKPNFTSDFFFLELEILSPLSISSLFLPSFSAKPLTSKNRQILKNAPFESTLSSERRGETASIVLLRADDSSEFGSLLLPALFLFSCFTFQNTPLKGKITFLTVLAPSIMNFSAMNGSSIIRRKLLEVLFSIWSVGRGKG